MSINSLCHVCLSHIYIYMCVCSFLQQCLFTFETMNLTSSILQMSSYTQDLSCIKDIVDGLKEKQILMYKAIETFNHMILESDLKF